jgi:anthranilate phosphoribosyltransferase
VQFNAGAIRELFDGSHSPFREIVVLNSAAALVIGRKASDLSSGAAIAAEAIDSRRAKDVLSRVVEFSTRAAA